MAKYSSIEDKELQLLIRRKRLNPSNITITDAISFNPDLAPFFGKLVTKVSTKERDRILRTYAGENLKFDSLRSMLKINGGRI